MAELKRSAEKMRLLFSLFALIASLAVMPAFAAAQPTGLTSVQFEKKIELGIDAIRGNVPFSVETAVDLVRTSNTLSLIRIEKTKLEQEFLRLAVGHEYADRLTQALGDWTLNAGMGLCFKKHDLHWGGLEANIRERDRFTIVDQK